jgi:Polyketide cyclase / dehydrase and lipid transport
MRNPFGTIILGVAFAVGVASVPAGAQAPASGGSPVVPHPTYTSIPMEITVNRPAAEVWKRVGKYCDVAEWLQVPAGCKIIAGKDGEVGAVRSVGNGEVLVSKTEFSYTYAQTPKEGTPFNLYHGNVEVRPVTPTTSKILYTLFYDNSMLPDNAAREKDKEARRARFTQAIANMKILAEGGTLPPAPPPAPAR